MQNTYIYNGPISGITKGSQDIMFFSDGAYTLEDSDFVDALVAAGYLQTTNQFAQGTLTISLEMQTLLKTNLTIGGE